MSWLLGVRHIVRSLLHRGQADDDTREELAFHLARQTQKHIDAGVSPNEAARLAAIELGGATQWRETTAHARRGSWMFDAISDARYAIRGLIARPGFALSALATVAIGTGAAITIFTLADGALLRPLPFRDPAQLVSVVLRMPRGSADTVDMVWSYPKFELLQRQQTTFSALALHHAEFVVVGAENGSDRVPAETAGYEYFQMLGVQPIAGRVFTAEEDRRGGPSAVVILSEGFWRARYAGRTSAVGESVMIAGVRHTIIGVLPAGFHGLGGNAELWIPIPDARGAGLQAAGAHNLDLLARLRPGVSVAAARASVAALGRAIDAQYPETNGHWGATARSLDEIRVPPAIRRSIRLLAIAVALLVAIVCVNLGTLLRTRAAARRQEFAVRAALGAERARVARQLWTEGAVIVGAGTVIGVVLAAIASRTLATMFPLSAPTTSATGDLARVAFGAVAVGPRALGFGLLLALALTALIGIVSTLQATPARLASALREGTSSSSRRGIAGGDALVVAQIALALVFLVASGLTIESVRETLAIPLGYRPEKLLSVQVALDPTRAATDSNPLMWRALTEEIRAVPGVAMVGVGSCSPLGMHCDGTTIAPVGHVGASHVAFRTASPEFFATLGTRVLRGRAFTNEDITNPRHVAIINEAAARAIWGGDDPLTTPISADGSATDVVGIVENARYEDVEQPAEPAMWVPQRSSRGVVFVRTASDPATVTSAVRAAIRRVSAGHAIGETRTMSDRLRDATARNRLSLELFTAFGASALLLAAIGLYGSLALRVALRTRELAIRRALGASNRSLVASVAKPAAAATVIGTAAGMAAAFAVARLLAALLYHVTALDGRVYSGASLVLLVALALAAAIPTARTLKTDPRVAMRAE